MYIFRKLWQLDLSIHQTIHGLNRKTSVQQCNLMCILNINRSYPEHSKQVDCVMAFCLFSIYLQSDGLITLKKYISLSFNLYPPFLQSQTSHLSQTNMVSFTMTGGDLVSNLLTSFCSFCTVITNSKKDVPHVWLLCLTSQGLWLVALVSSSKKIKNKKSCFSIFCRMFTCYTSLYIL